MSTFGITTSLLSQIAGSPSAANEFVTDLNQLAQDLQSGNLAAAQQDYVTLTNDALNGATSTTASSSASGITTSVLSDVAASTGSATSFVNELNLLGTDLENGDLSSAQQDLQTLDAGALNAANSAGTTSTASTNNEAEIAYMAQAAAQAMEAGDDSIISTVMYQLASVSPNTTGAAVLEQEGESYGSGGSSLSSSVNQLLQSLDAGSSDSTQSLLDTLA